jgi:hypothetical protein
MTITIIIITMIRIIIKKMIITMIMIMMIMIIMNSIKKEKSIIDQKVLIIINYIVIIVKLSGAVEIPGEVFTRDMNLMEGQQILAIFICICRGLGMDIVDMDRSP